MDNRQRPIRGGILNAYGCANFYIKRIPHTQANQTVRENHYSGTICSTSRIHLGLFVDGEFVGVAQFGCMMNPHATERIVRDTHWKDALELNRLWVHDKAPRNTESRFISYCIKFIRKVEPNAKWIQSFADERCGRFGVLYQACNFLYLGEHTSSFYECDGEWFHKLIATNLKDRFNQPKCKRLTAALSEGRAKEVKLRQFRYLYFLDPRKRKDLVMEIKPYPKH